MKTVIIRAWLYALVVAATPAQADGTSANYLILAESQAVEGDQTCVQTCFGDLDCRAGT